jgi:hypothetical protein
MSLLFWGGASAGRIQGTAAGRSELAGVPHTATGIAAGRGGLAGIFRIDESLGGAIAATTLVVGSLAELAGRAFGQGSLVGTMDFPVEPPCCLDAAAVYVPGLAVSGVYVPGLRAGFAVC